MDRAAVSPSITHTYAPVHITLKVRFQTHLLLVSCLRGEAPVESVE